MGLWNMIGYLYVGNQSDCTKPWRWYNFSVNNFAKMKITIVRKYLKLKVHNISYNCLMQLKSGVRIKEYHLTGNIHLRSFFHFR